MARTAGPTPEGGSSVESSPFLSLRVLTYPKNGQWYAHCLDLDLITQRSTQIDAYRELLAQIQLYLETAATSGDLAHLVPRKAPMILRFRFELASVVAEIRNLLFGTRSSGTYRIPFDWSGRPIGA